MKVQFKSALPSSESLVDGSNSYFNENCGLVISSVLIDSDNSELYTNYLEDRIKTALPLLDSSANKDDIPDPDRTPNDP